MQVFDFSVLLTRLLRPEYTYRCDVRIFTLILVFPVIMTVEIMLMLRVHALCKLIMKNGFSSWFIYDLQTTIPG
jgi:hypothetical protein